MKLEKIVNNGKNILAGAGLISLLSLSAVRCATGDDYDYSGGGGTPTRSRYICDCEGNGIFATMEIYTDSRYSAESATTAQCREDYPGTGCSCDCVKYEPASPCVDDCSPHFALKCDIGPEGERGSWKCQEYWVNSVRCLQWVWKGTEPDEWNDACR